MKLLGEYFKLQNEIYEYFGYQEDWVVIPMESKLNYFWYIDPTEKDHVIYWESKKDVVELGQWYQDGIYTQRFLPKWVYRGPEFTMICTNPGVDGNKFLSVFDNTKEHKSIPTYLQDGITKLDGMYNIV